MARAARDAKLDTRTARLKLKPGRYFVLIVAGLSLMYRRTVQGSGSWSVRIAGTDGRESYSKLADADDYQDADGDTVLKFSQAQERARDFHKEAKSVSTGKPVTVEEAAKLYMAWFKENRKSVRETEATINAHILPALGDKLLMELDSNTIKKWHAKLATTPARKRSGKAATKQAFQEQADDPDKKRARKSTANRILTVLKAILNKAFQDGLVSDDTAWRRVKPFENADEPVTRFLKADESIRLINSCRADFRPLVKAALFTGARYGELARLQAKDVNTDTGLIYISPEAKSGKGRHIPLSAEGLDFFQSTIVGKIGKDYVFTRIDGDPWGKNHHVRLLKAACEQAKIEPAVGFHDLRHTYASLLAQAGADLLTISKLLGHADTRITSRHYAHLCDKTLATAVRTLLPSFGHVPEGKVKNIHGKGL